MGVRNTHMEHSIQEATKYISLLTRSTETNLPLNSKLKSTLRRMAARLLTSQLTPQSVHMFSHWQLQTSSQDGESMNLPLRSQLITRLARAWLLMPISLKVCTWKLLVETMLRMEEMSVC